MANLRRRANASKYSTLILKGDVGSGGCEDGAAVGGVMERSLIKVYQSCSSLEIGNLTKIRVLWRFNFQ